MLLRRKALSWGQEKTAFALWYCCWLLLWLEGKSGIEESRAEKRTKRTESGTQQEYEASAKMEETSAEERREDSVERRGIEEDKCRRNTCRHLGGREGPELMHHPGLRVPLCVRPVQPVTARRRQDCYSADTPFYLPAFSTGIPTAAVS